MKKIHLFSTLAAVPLLGMTACSSTENSSKETTFNQAPGISLNTKEVEMVDSQNSFAWRMLGEVNAEAKGKNSACSPLSMVYCLGMVNTGAEGRTSAEITSTLGFSTGADAINQHCARLMKELPAQDNTTTFNIANCVEVNSPYTLQSDYKKTVENSYSALVENRDFSENDFSDHLNGWVSKQTQGMIPKLFDKTDPSAVAYIVNALYFKGIWASKFDKANTTKADFFKTDGSSAKVDMMYQKENFMYTATNLYQALSLDYGNGAYAMQILLPAEGKTIGEVIDAVKKQNWNDIITSMGGHEVAVYLPKFTIEHGGEMNSLLKRLGINTMFTTAANFPKFCNADVYISKVIQKTKIEVTEDGTKAAAATGAEVALTSIGPSDTITFRADRPFIYVITEHSTGTICFSGVFSGE